VRKGEEKNYRTEEESGGRSDENKLRTTAKILGGHWKYSQTKESS